MPPTRTVLDKVEAAIVATADPKGASRQAIQKCAAPVMQY